MSKKDVKLSEGALKAIMNGQNPPDPIMQIVMAKKVVTANSDKGGRFRVLISDGKHSMAQAMITTKVALADVPALSVVKLTQYTLTTLNSAGKGPHRVLLILDMNFVATPDEVDNKVIGNPVTLGSPEDKENGPSTSNGVASEVKAVPKTEPPSPYNDGNGGLNQSLSESRIINPITSLSPYHNKWIIKARVTNKGDIRTWSNSRGEGKLFSFEVMDESGEIRATAFRDAVDKFYDFLQVDKVYYISKCQLKPANKQFNSLKNDYEMTLTSETVIEECVADDGAVPQVKYNFITINKIAEMEPGTLIDVIGICKSSSDLQTFTSKTTNRELKKREVILIDQTKTSIELTLWGSQAETFNGVNNPVIVIKGAKVGEFGGGKNVSTLMSSQLKINPDVPECYRIKGWFDIEGNNVEVKNLSEKTGVGNFQAPWLTFKEVQEQGLGNKDKGDYYQVKATILLIRSENALYKACPTPECNKKVVDLENGMYRCEKCSREFPNFKYRLLVSMNIGDWSGNQWVSLFASEAEKILGKTSEEIGRALENDPEAATKAFNEANFKSFIFKCRAKMEIYNDETRLKTVVVRVDPVNFEEHNSYLVEKIQKYLP